MSNQGLEFLDEWLAENITPVVNLSIHGDGANSGTIFNFFRFCVEVPLPAKQKRPEALYHLLQGGCISCCAKPLFHLLLQQL